MPVCVTVVEVSKLGLAGGGVTEKPQITRQQNRAIRCPLDERQQRMRRLAPDGYLHKNGDRWTHGYCFLDTKSL